MSPQVEFEVAEGVATVVLRRPEKRNAMTADMWRALAAEFDALGGRDDVAVVVLQGSGGSFSAGGDLASVKDAAGREDPEYRALAEAGLRAVRDCARPTIALVDGPCIGAGCLIAVACDVRFATPAATFGIPAVRYGLEVERHGLARLVALLGLGQANRFLLSAATWAAPEAAAAGLVEVCSAEAEPLALAHARAVAGCRPETVRATRRALAAVAGVDADPP